MALIEIVIALALLQYFVFAALVGQARTRYGVKAPAVTGHEMFERYYRVQMNTIEVLVILLPSLWLAGRYWPTWLVSSLGVVYLVGRVIYLRGYVADPKRRSLGFTLSMGPTVILLLAALLGSVRAALA